MTSLDPSPAASERALALPTGGPTVPSRSLLRSLRPDEITVTGGLWGHYESLNATVIIEHCLTWMERIGWIGNFDRAASGTIGTTHDGIEFVDSEVYKLLEAMAWELGRENTPELATRYASLVARVGAAQEPDGYLNTSFGRPGQRARFSDLEWGHELYCLGHLVQAAVARLRTGYDDELPAIARRAADQAYQEFGPDGRAAVCGHPEVEVALVEFYRATGEQRYLELAQLFVERRGHGTLAPIDYGPEYFQDDMPVRDAHVMRGHAVRALYLAAGALDVATETGDTELADAVRSQWSNTVARRTYITGGMGSRHRDESFGADYELPPDRAYSETCAGIASVMLSWRLQLASDDVKYADQIERTLLNNVLVSPREDGQAFFYANALHQRIEGSAPHPTEVSARADSSLRAPWFAVSCCPTNVARTLASARLYFATADDSGIQVHQYGNFTVDTLVGTERARISVASDYPYDGRIAVTVDATPDASFDLRLRIPAWARDDASWHTDSPRLTLAAANGYLHVTGEFASGDTVILDLPMAARFTYPDPQIDAVRGQVAVERGPLVLALESVDLPEAMSLSRASINTDAPLLTTPNGATVEMSQPAVEGSEHEWPYGPAGDSALAAPQVARVELHPYYQWANRGPSTMRVFSPTAHAAAR